MYLGVFLVGLVLLGILYDFCTWMYLNFLNFRKLSDLMFSNMTFVPFCLYSPSGISIMQMLVHLMLSQRSLKLSSFLFIPFFFFLFNFSDVYFYLQLVDLFLLCYLLYCWFLIVCFKWRRKWQPTPVFLPGESHGQRSLVGCCPWGRTESEMTEAT